MSEFVPRTKWRFYPLGFHGGYLEFQSFIVANVFTVKPICVDTQKPDGGR